eukprot:129474-Rhodomonas_salina.1
MRETLTSLGLTSAETESASRTRLGGARVGWEHAGHSRQRLAQGSSRHVQLQQRSTSRSCGSLGAQTRRQDSERTGM